MTARTAVALFDRPTFRPFVSAALLLHSLRNLPRLHISKLADTIAVFHYGNERRAIARAGFSIKDGIHYEGPQNLSFLKHISWRGVTRWQRVSRRCLRKNGFLIGARQAEFLALYLLFDRIFSNTRGRTFISASESNPEIIGITLAAKRAGNRNIYVSHGALENELGLFFHDEVRVPGPAYVEHVRSHLADADPRFVVSPIRPLKLPIAHGPVRKIGIVCSIVVDSQKLAEIFRACTQAFPEAEIVVREHPNPTFRRVKSRRSSAPLTEAARDWSFAIVGNSSAHLDLLEIGVPTIYANIDGFDDDVYGFLRDGLVPSVKEARDISADMAAIYEDPRWPEIFARFNGV